MEALRDTIVTVDLGRIGRNMDKIRNMVGPDVAVMPVIKANGYGCGAVGIAPTLMEHGAAYLAVATLTEAIELRTAYPDYPVFILGHTPARFLEHVVDGRFTQTVIDYDHAKALSDVALAKGTKATVHLKMETGFHRLGTSDKEELLKMAKLPAGPIAFVIPGPILDKQESDAVKHVATS